MTDIMAAIGLKQFERYPGLMARRHSIIQKYDAMCDELGVMHLTHAGEDFRSSGHLYLTRIPGITTDQRQEIIVKLAEMVSAPTLGGVSSIESPRAADDPFIREFLPGNASRGNGYID